MSGILLYFCLAESVVLEVITPANGGSLYLGDTFTARCVVMFRSDIHYENYDARSLFGAAVTFTVSELQDGQKFIYYQTGCIYAGTLFLIHQLLFQIIIIKYNFNFFINFYLNFFIFIFFRFSF